MTPLDVDVILIYRVILRTMQSGDQGLSTDDWSQAHRLEVEEVCAISLVQLQRSTVGF